MRVDDELGLANVRAARRFGLGLRGDRLAVNDHLDVVIWLTPDSMSTAAHLRPHNYPQFVPRASIERR